MIVEIKGKQIETDMVERVERVKDTPKPCGIGSNGSLKYHGEVWPDNTYIEKHEGDSFEPTYRCRIVFKNGKHIDIDEPYDVVCDKLKISKHSSNSPIDANSVNNIEANKSTRKLKDILKLIPDNVYVRVKKTDGKTFISGTKAYGFLDGIKSKAIEWYGDWDVITIKPDLTRDAYPNKLLKECLDIYILTAYENDI